MANEICILCWKKDASEVFVSGKVRVCRGCKYEVDRVLNFMQYFGMGMFPLDEHIHLGSPKPPTPNKPAKKAGKPREDRAEGEGGATDQQGTFDEVLEEA